MDLRYGPEAARYRAKIRDLLENELPDGWSGIGTLSAQEAKAFLGRWRSFLARNGLLALSWPAKYGGSDLSMLERVVLAEELTRLGVPDGGPNDVHGVSMLGNTLLRWGTDDQRQRFLPRILSGADVWCQGFSEPDAGSDLANVQTRAVLDGDEWVINGQKLWTSAGHLANWIFLLVRTDPSAPLHKGLSFLLCPMAQAGVDIRPIRMISGASEFNEVFLTDARTARDNVVGPVGEGWRVAMTLLGFERGESLPALSIRFRREFDRLVALAKHNGTCPDPVVRQRIAGLYARVEVLRMLGYRVMTTLLAGRDPGPEASLSKLFWSTYHAEITELAVDILGVQALSLEGRPPNAAFQIDDPGTPNSSASWVGEFLNARGELIAAGTSEIQRNILAEKVLGLPRDSRRPAEDEAAKGRMRCM
jgi:alkylation response protein AidB-like acyl-CoA dehydrogenase